MSTQKLPTVSIWVEPERRVSPRASASATPIPAAAEVKAEGDAIVWFAYPKRSSKKYRSQIDRDNGWNILGREGFEPVRMVAIDEDLSAIRFRRATFIKSMTRPKEYRLSERGQVKA